MAEVFTVTKMNKKKLAQGLSQQTIWTGNPNDSTGDFDFSAGVAYSPHYNEESPWVVTYRRQGGEYKEARFKSQADALAFVDSERKKYER
jgi:carbohydrate-binding DOMON domain-containing protein